jgi:hypothetical protein
MRKPFVMKIGKQPSKLTALVKNNTLFTKQASTGLIVIPFYVDDLVLGETDDDEIQKISALLDAKFSNKDLGSLKYLLGFEVARTQAC